MDKIGNWRLGLDLGTNSIGWAVLKLDKDEDKFTATDIHDLGVRLFSDGREPAGEGRIGDSLAVARRTARGIRKNLRRRKQRKRALLKQLVEDKLFPDNKTKEDKEKRESLKSLNPYELRIKALDEKLKPEELGRALFHLGVRRGFKSNRKDAGEEAIPDSLGDKTKTIKDPNKMTQGEKCLALKDTIKESSYRTIGEFLYHQNIIDDKTKHLSGLRFAPGRFSYYPLRELYEVEFDAIRKKQESFYPNVHWDEIKKIIISQRPLKKQERGKCQFMIENERAFKALPSIQHFRMLQEINNLKMYDEKNNPLELTNEEREILFQLLDSKKEVKFDEMRKKLNNKYRFNLESELRSFLNGNDTARMMRQEKCFGTLWDTIDITEQDNIIELLIDAESDEEVLSKLEKYQLSEEQKKKIAHHQFSGGTASVCKEFAQQINPFMHKEWILYHEAVAKLGFNHSEENVEKSDLLPYYGKILIGSTIGGGKSDSEKEPEKKYGKIGNPTVHFALNQVKTVVNFLIKQYGKPTQIVVEVSRELKASREARDDMIKKQAKNIKENERINQNIKELKIPYPNRADRLKFRLWEELGGKEQLSRKCIYCGKVIGCGELFSDNIEIEHILPYSKTLMDGEGNKTLAHSDCNKVKAERSPWEAFHSNPKGFNWDDICERMNRLPKEKRQKFSMDAMTSLETGFIDRQLTDNAYLSKISRKYLKAVCDDVWVITGQATKLLRDRWQVDEILKKKITKKEILEFGLSPEMIGQYKKNRYDHRHHALDAVVIGFTDRSMIQEISTKNAKRKKSQIEVPERPFTHLELVEKVKNIVPSFKPDHGPEGKLSKETALGKIKQEKQIEIKELKEDMVRLIKSDKVRADFEAEIDKSNFKQAKESLKDIYPTIKIYNEIFVSRTALSSLKKTDDIVDKKIKETIENYLKINPDGDFQKRMEEFSQKTGIKKVRCKTFAQTPIKIEKNPNNPKSADRYYNPLDYFTAIIWEIPPAKEGKKPAYQAEYLRRDEVTKDGKPKKRNENIHPAAKKICELYKDDYIEFSENGIWKKARVAGYSATQNKLDIRPVYAANDVRDWVIATSELMSESGWKEIKGSYFNSVNVLFGEKSARKITVNPIGKVFRK
jgi:CRISPR-associated endonuclease Csn1